MAAVLIALVALLLLLLALSITRRARPELRGVESHLASAEAPSPATATPDMARSTPGLRLTPVADTPPAPLSNSPPTPAAGPVSTPTEPDFPIELTVDAPPERVPELAAAVNVALAADADLASASGPMQRAQRLVEVVREVLAQHGVDIAAPGHGVPLPLSMTSVAPAEPPRPVEILLPLGVDAAQLAAVLPSIAEAMKTDPAVANNLRAGDHRAATQAAQIHLMQALRERGLLTAEGAQVDGGVKVRLNLS